MNEYNEILDYVNELTNRNLTHIDYITFVNIDGGFIRISASTSYNTGVSFTIPTQDYEEIQNKMLQQKIKSLYE